MPADDRDGEGGVGQPDSAVYLRRWRFVPLDGDEISAELRSDTASHLVVDHDTLETATLTVRLPT